MDKEAEILVLGRNCLNRSALLEDLHPEKASLLRPQNRSWLGVAVLLKKRSEAAEFAPPLDLTVIGEDEESEREIEDCILNKNRKAERDRERLRFYRKRKGRREGCIYGEMGELREVRWKGRS